MIASKFNRKFNAKRKRIERWHLIVIKLSEFEGIINNYDGASPDEIRTLRTIHKGLYNFQVMAKEILKEVENFDGFLR